MAAIFVLGTWIAPALPASAQGGPGAAPVPVTRPVVKRITEWDEYTGRFEAIGRVELRARVSGYLVSRHFTDGQTVKAGDRLFTIDPDLFAVAVDVAKAEVARLEAQLEFTRDDLERAQALAARQTVTGRELDQRQATFRQAQAGVASAKAALRNAELNLSYTEVKAPMAGRISSAAIDPGNFIQGGAGGGTVLTTIVALSPIHFVFEASEANYLRYNRLAEEGLRPSGRLTKHPVQVRLSSEEAFKHKGTLDFVDNEMRPGTGTIRSRAILDNPDGTFTPGMFGRLRLPASAEYEAILIPDSAISADQNRRLVTVVKEDGTVEPRAVSLGPLHEGLRIVRDGLAPDERIAVGGMHRIRPGGKVQPVEEPAAVKASEVNAAPAR